MSSYLDLLRRADAHFDRVAREQGRHLLCRRGCTLCCYGAFEIGAADVPVIAEGLAKLDPSSRDAIIERAEQMIRVTDHPNLRNVSEEEKDAFFRRSAEVACPALDESGACTIYEYRPLVCRTFGLPLRDGNSFLGEVCELNFTTATKDEQERAAWDLQWEDVLGEEDQFTVAEAIVLASRLFHDRNTTAAASAISVPIEIPRPRTKP